MISGLVEGAKGQTKKEILKLIKTRKKKEAESASQKKGKR